MFTGGTLKSHRFASNLIKKGENKLTTDQPADQQPIDRYDDDVEAFSDIFGELMRLTTDDWINLDISTAQIKVIFVLHFGGTHTVNQLAEKMNIKQSTTSHLVEKLVQAGYVSRVGSRADRRVIELHLTAQGHLLADRLSGVTHKDIIAGWVTQFTENQRVEFRNILNTLLTIIRNGSRE